MRIENTKISVLQKKSKENYLCAVLADKNGLYNSAVSRYYYSCFILAKRCAYEKGWVTDQDFENKKQSTHRLLEEQFVNKQISDTNISCANLVAIQQFTAIKRHRREAEYSHSIDYSLPIQVSEYDYCRSMAKNFIRAIESIYNISIIEEPTDV